jgi:hypothetical protein
MNNKYGLSRNIPSEIKREIRKRSGFGCVFCGLAIATYEHVDAEFNHAKEHDPNKMTYLCGQCHSKVTRGFLSKETIEQAMQNPWCIKNNKCHEYFDIAKDNFLINIAGTILGNISNIISFEGHPLLSIFPPEDINAPFRLSGEFFDKSENLLLKIENNEWTGNPDNWDVECVGGKIIVRTSPGDIALQLKCTRNAAISIEKINMYYKGSKIIGDETELHILSPDDIDKNRKGAVFNSYGSTLFGMGIHVSRNGIGFGPG